MKKNSKNNNFFKNNFINSLLIIFRIINRKKGNNEFFILFFIVSFQAILDVLSLASIIPLLYILKGNEVINDGQHNNFKTLGINYEFFLDNNQIDFLIPLGVIFLMIIATIFRIFLIKKTNNFIENTRHNISVKLMKNFLKNSPILNIDTTEIAKSILSEVDQFMIIVFEPVILMLTNIVLLLGISFYLIYTSLKASLVGLITLALFYLLFYLFSKNILNLQGYRSERSNKGRFQTAIESFKNLKDIRIYNAEEYFIKRFSRFSRIFADTNAIYTSLTASPKYVIEMIVFIVLALTILFFVITNTISFSVIPLLGTFAFAAYKSQPSLSSVIFGINSIEYGSKIISNLYELIYKEFNHHSNQKLAFKYLNSQKDYCVLINNLTFNHVDGSNKKGIRNINLKIKYNSFFIIIGESGSGKTTLLNLIAGLINGNKGSITYNTFKNNRRKPTIAYLHQKHSLIDASVKQNVAFGLQDDEIDEEKVIKSLKQAEIYDYVKTLKNKINTNVGEDGSKLSAGQIQRIALARSLYINPDIIILDEPSSALDKKTEVKIMKTLHNLSKTKTIIMSSHRLDSLSEFKNLNFLDISRSNA